MEIGNDLHIIIPTRNEHKNIIVTKTTLILSRKMEKLFLFLLLLSFLPDYYLHASSSQYSRPPPRQLIFTAHNRSQSDPEQVYIYIYIYMYIIIILIIIYIYISGARICSRERSYEGIMDNRS